jgi:hypothetical protein
MRAYVVTSGAIFGLVVMAHVLRFFAEGLQLARNPWFDLVTLAAATLCTWAFLTLRSPARS